jgi:hypothetical protein
MSSPPQASTHLDRGNEVDDNLETKVRARHPDETAPRAGELLPRDTVIGAGARPSGGGASTDHEATGVGPAGGRETVVRWRDAPHSLPELPTSRVKIRVPKVGQRWSANRVWVRVVLILAVGAAIVVVIVAANSGGSKPKSGPSGTVPPILVIRSVNVTVSPVAGVLHCPSATVLYAAAISTNGNPGQLSYRWMRPDGSEGPTNTANLNRGQANASTELSFTFTGNGSASGHATLIITSPPYLPTDGPEISYRCP